MLTELDARLSAAREKPRAKGRAAIQHISDLPGVPEEEAAQTVAAMEAQANVTWELLMRRVVETWLEEQRKACQDRRSQ